jgi:hypothetical protein
MDSDSSIAEGGDQNFGDSDKSTRQGYLVVPTQHLHPHSLIAIDGNITLSLRNLVKVFKRLLILSFQMTKSRDIRAFRY